ncbi:hypothetical protein AB0425_17845 [Actinosynnema sp. NPDC051121]
MSTEQGSVGRFAWERAVRRSNLPMHLKGYLFLLGTYMDADGSNCRPSAAELEAAAGRSRQRVFEVLAELEAAGWFASVKRPGKPSVRTPRIPAEIPVDVTSDPSDTSDYSEQGTSDGSYGSEAPEVVHTRQTGLTDPSDGSDAPVRPVLHDHVSTTSGPQENGAAPAPDPRRTGRAEHARTDDQPAADVLPDVPTGLDQETHVPRRGRAKCEPHGLAAGNRPEDGLPRCPLCRRDAGPIAPVIQLPFRRAGGGGS